jgi:hypothetical protein
MILDSGDKKSAAPNMDFGAVDWSDGKVAIQGDGSWH